MIDIGRKAASTAIRDARLRAGLTQEKAAALRGHATSTISRWETGAVPQTWDELHEYAKALGQPIVLSFGASENTHPGEPEWASVLDAIQINRKLIELLLPPEKLAEAQKLAANLRALPPPRGAMSLEETGSQGPGGGSPQAQADESPQVPNGER